MDHFSKVIQADKSNEEIRGKCQWLALSTIRVISLSYLPNLWQFTKLYPEHTWGRKLGGNIITLTYNLSKNLLEIWHIWQKHVWHTSDGCVVLKLGPLFFKWEQSFSLAVFYFSVPFLLYAFWRSITFPGLDCSPNIIVPVSILP